MLESGKSSLQLYCDPLSRYDSFDGFRMRHCNQLVLGDEALSLAVNNVTFAAQTLCLHIEAQAMMGKHMPAAIFDAACAFMESNESCVYIATFKP